MVNNPFCLGPVYLDTQPKPIEQIEDNLKAFIRRPSSYRHQFLQANYGVAFDGYSYDGQQDSLNQGADDPLHSFVLSDFSAVGSFPIEFAPFLNDHWPSVCDEITQIELQLLNAIDTVLSQQFMNSFGHMISANYYPKQIARQSIAPDLRLSEHPDVSLMTVFPNGVDACFQYQDPATKQWCSVDPHRPMAFAGHLLEWLTDGQIKALNHRVIYDRADNERCSFALFSLPYPDTRLTSLAGATITAEAFYKEHLSLWD